MISALLEQAYQRRAAGDSAKARELYGRVADLARDSGNSGALSHALRHMSDIDRGDGDAAAALLAANEAVVICEAVGDGATLELANALRLSALARDQLGDDAAAGFWFRAREAYAKVGVEAGAQECDMQLAGRRK